MSWLTNLVPPKLRALVQKVDVPDNLWSRCPSCGQMIFHRELIENQHVCHHCQHHLRISAKERLAITFDEGKYNLLPSPKVVADPLKFKDSKKYTDRLRDSRAKTNADDAVLAATGSILGRGLVIAAFNFEFMGGSMGMAVGESILAAAKTAVEKNLPLVIFPSTGGARMQEGILSLMQLPRTVIATTMMKERRLPIINVLCDPTTGGVSASFAMLGDITIAEPKAIIGFAGARVIEETIKQKLPEGFQTAEYLLEHGMVDIVCHRHKMRETLSQIIGFIHG
ncbi:MAG: acetyl-CoA carboxylase carboxyltransferase subunit beta [Alphaproteobacteria bacterium]|nr:acetyl-CoA carboxylase carboxyltransferase subunit beta [Alphaproteobacteria bacterium]OJV47955.1 MAG: acetyl-CoA carboxylase subunit beta [Alphaproteobacteria bacterium 43-37]